MTIVNNFESALVAICFLVCATIGLYIPVYRRETLLEKQILDLEGKCERYQTSMLYYKERTVMLGEKLNDQPK